MGKYKRTRKSTYRQKKKEKVIAIINDNREGNNKRECLQEDTVALVFIGWGGQQQRIHW